MARKTKSELEEGNYIVYTDEPDTIVDAGSGGGGGNLGKCTFTIIIDSVDLAPTSFDNKIKLNDELLSGFESRSVPGAEGSVSMLDVTADAFSLLEIPLSLGDIPSFSVNSVGFVDTVIGDVLTHDSFTVYTPTPAFNGTSLTVEPD